jgi:peptidoglycan/LPS O-acetylase OafA/YrhL
VVWIAIFPALGCLLFVACGHRQLPLVGGLVRRLGDASYTIYLGHLFLVVPLRQLVQAAPGEFEPLTIALVWGAGVLGSLGLTTLVQRVLGSHSRRWIGS